MSHLSIEQTFIFENIGSVQSGGWIDTIKWVELLCGRIANRDYRSSEKVGHL